MKDVATLWIGQEVVDIIWNSHDLDVYVVVEKGYEKWSALDSFSEKRKFSIETKILSANYSTYKEGLILFTENLMVSVVKNEQIISSVKMEGITSIAVDKNLIFSTTKKGVLSYNLMDSRHPPVEVKLFSGSFSIVGIYNNQIICLSSNRTTVFVLKSK